MAPTSATFDFTPEMARVFHFREWRRTKIWFFPVFVGLNCAALAFFFQAINEPTPMSTARPSASPDGGTWSEWANLALWGVVLSVIWLIFYGMISGLCAFSRRAARSTWEKYCGPDVWGRNTVTISAAGVTEDDRTTRVFRRWNAVHDVDSDPRQVYIYCTRVFPIIVPKSAFSTREEAEDFLREVVRLRGESAGDQATAAQGSVMGDITPPGEFLASVTFTLTVGEVLAMTRRHLCRWLAWSFGLGAALWLLAVVLATAIGTSLAILGPTESSAPLANLAAYSALAGTLLLGVGILLVAAFWTPLGRVLVRLLTEYRMGSGIWGPATISLGVDAVYERTMHSASCIRWRPDWRLDETETHVVIWISRLAGWPIPVGAFADEAARFAFVGVFLRCRDASGLSRMPESQLGS